MTKNNRQSGFSLIELIAVMVITSLILISVLRLYQQSIDFTVNLRQRISQESQVNFCLDMMTTDIIDSVSSQGKLEILPPKGIKTLGGISITQTDPGNKVSREISWVAAEDENETYTLYRKDYSKQDQNGSDVYYPVCDGVAEFDITLLNENGLEDPNSAPAVMELLVDSYFNNNSEQTFSSRRTFCLRRNEILNLPDVNEILLEEAEIKKNTERKPRTSTNRNSSNRTGSGNSKVPTKSDLLKELKK